MSSPRFSHVNAASLSGYDSDSALNNHRRTPSTATVEGNSTTTPAEGLNNNSSTPPLAVCSTSSQHQMSVTADSSLARAESYKDQRKKYRREKKRVARELLSTLKDPSVVVLADWLKVRGSLKGWTKLYCVLKPGMLLLYKSSKAKSSHWCGTVLLNTCELIERPSKKDGFCFKLFHPLEQSIWATKGPQGESIGAVILPLPSSHLIFRAPSQAAGKCWMDAMELSMRCSSILLRSMTSSPGRPDAIDGLTEKWNEADIERHFMDQDLDDASHTDDNQRSSCGQFTDTDSDEDRPTLEGAASNALYNNRGRRRADAQGSVSSEPPGEEEEEEYEEEEEEEEDEEDVVVRETSYIVNQEDFVCGGSGSAGQQEVLGEENKSLIWHLVKQVRPGMDLSKVVLPTFILEPRSFLDKLADYYYHCDILSKAVLEDDPFDRMKEVVRWYLSGFYKKPKGLKKPYNPILGETFRCYWKHPNGSRTFYVAEQVSHHPPVSALYVVNRQEGFAITATVLAKSKFYGNSTSAILDGCVRLCLLPRGEEYVLTMPYAHCKGILMGTLSMELGGKVTIDCEKTGYSAEIEFKLKPFLSGYDANNLISGKLRLGKETLATVQGHWDSSMSFTSAKTGDTEDLWVVNQTTKEKRLPRYTVTPEQQGAMESERLWLLVSQAIHSDNQVAATEEKSILEEIQRSDARERKAKCEEWIPKYFRQDPATGEYLYCYSDVRPWDPRTDLFQYEYEYMISTKTRHKHLQDGRQGAVGSQATSLTASLLSMEHTKEGVRVGTEGGRLRGVSEGGESSSGPDLEDTVASTPIIGALGGSVSPPPATLTSFTADSNVLSTLDKLDASQGRLLTEVQSLRKELEIIHRRISSNQSSASTSSGTLRSSILVVLVTLFLQYLWGWLFRPASS